MEVTPEYDRKALQRVVKTPHLITGSLLLSIEAIQGKRCLRKTPNIIKDCSHPNHRLFTPFPSGRRYRSLLSSGRRLHIYSEAYTQTHTEGHYSN
ncbi:hypothetical protein AALO_G00186010 [Alosa alosa]|uniref:Uncharacterized protein n=1 Tax=Alosa alosa TaxID=278164 RepID=A0AAV6G9Z4_9TELE|nr:hypothetical protein AALO_G00186010 [Alosa alosa]